MPDSVPIVGPVERWRGLFLALSHGHLGVTDSPRTAELIAAAIAAAGAENSLT